ncbi:MAG: helix-turn-helix domain-containing protein [Clostridia bacterium]|nr:helix-turn-helix domain-containing protein [Clostridia bacterium]
MFENISDILTFNECKQLLKVGKNTMLDLLHSGQIEAFKIGNRWKIPKDNILEYLYYK